MVNIILGLLMLKGMSAYELHVIIKKNYQDICSSSIGNIQLALKKLTSLNLVTFQEEKEKNVHRKIFLITPQGREQFLSWMNSPIEIGKAKNLEIGKLLFMGFLKKDKQLEMMDATIKDLEEQVNYFNSIKHYMNMKDNKNQILMDYLNTNAEYKRSLLASTHQENLENFLENISAFGVFTLQFGMDAAIFQLNWFKNLRKEIEER